MTTLSVPDGEDLLGFVSGLSGPDDAWVNAVGTLEDVELAVAGDDGERAVIVAGSATLLSLSGPRSGPLMAVIAARSGDGAVAGGRLVRGRSTGVHLAVAGDGAAVFVATPVDDPPTAATAGSPAPITKSASSEDEETEEEPRYGDYVDHFVFGLCEVMTVREERVKIRPVTGVRKLREIHLGAMKVLKPTEQQGKRVFRLVKRG